jgi:hypothetical protein
LHKKKKYHKVLCPKATTQETKAYFPGVKRPKCFVLAEIPDLASNFMLAKTIKAGEFLFFKLSHHFHSISSRDKA